MVESILSELIPLFGIFMIVALVIGPIWIRSYFAAQERARLHETLRVAYEKGQTVPPELIQSLQSSVPDRAMPTPERDLRRAIVLMAVGAGLCALGYGMWYGLMSVDDTAAWITGTSVAAAGAIPGLIGVAYFFLWFSKRNAPKA
jgi:hypothetical protein